MKLSRIISLILTAVPVSAGAAIVLPDIVGDNMVVQQNAQVRLWGWSDKSAAVEVSASWNPAEKVTAQPDSRSGRWSVELPSTSASFDPQQIVIVCDGDTTTINNVLVGEVWFCSGQSNMEMPLGGFWTQPVEGAGEAIAFSASYPGIRVAKVPKAVSYEPQDRVAGPWKTSCPANAAEFSALAYFFAQALTQILDVPVGIIDCSYGGSKAEAWQSAEALAAYPEFSVERERNDTTINDWERVNVMYNAMLHPLIGYTVRGFLWNQGESNVGRHATYPYHLKDMVTEWRRSWNLGELPFYFVEIPGWNYENPDGDNAAMFRECQQFAATIIPNSGIVGTTDLVYPFEVDDIHARKKKEIGQRLAFMAAAKTYGIDGMPVDYPRFKSMRIAADGHAVLSFDNAPRGLTPHTGIEGFEVAGSDGVFHAATAVENPQTLEIDVYCPEVGTIKEVRFNFKNFIVGKVFNTIGLPLFPFRTDGQRISRDECM